MCEAWLVYRTLVMEAYSRSSGPRSVAGDVWSCLHDESPEIQSMFVFVGMVACLAHLIYNLIIGDGCCSSALVL
jgi:hypothetical protein